MSRNTLAIAARQSLQILVWQLGWLAALALVCGLFFGFKAGVSVLAGGGIVAMWTLYMALTLFKHSFRHGAGMSVLSVFVGWIVKMVTTLGLLVIAFRSKLFLPLPLLGGLFGALVAYWGWLTFRGEHAHGADGK